MLLANEAHKELKTKQRLEDQALDRKYAREYAEKLDKEEKVTCLTASVFWFDSFRDVHWQAHYLIEVLTQPLHPPDL